MNQVLKPPQFNEDAFANSPRLRHLRRYIERNYHCTITLDRAAQQAGLERTYFSTFFQQRTGVRFSQWLSYVRVKRAVEILRSDELSLARLAEMVGFGDLQAFEKAFEALTGMSPSGFQEKVSRESPHPDTRAVPQEPTLQSDSLATPASTGRLQPGGSYDPQPDPDLEDGWTPGPADDAAAPMTPRPLAEATLGELEEDLRGALRRGELQVYYQPIVSLEDAAVSALEALLRWQHPEYGLLLPKTFLELALRSGLLLSIDRWVVEQACRQLRNWRAQQPERSHLTVSINIAAAHLTVSGLTGEIEAHLRSSGLAPKDVKLEITESTVLQRSPSAIATVNDLQARGIGLYIDDFGTGYSCLSCLHMLPSECLKIDRSFIAGMLSNRVHNEIVGSIVSLAHRLGLLVIAEGVETRAQYDYLRELGCDYAQGFLFSKPMPPKKQSEIPSHLPP